MRCAYFELLKLIVESVVGAQNKLRRVSRVIARLVSECTSSQMLREKINEV